MEPGPPGRAHSTTPRPNPTSTRVTSCRGARSTSITGPASTTGPSSSTPPGPPVTRPTADRGELPHRQPVPAEALPTSDPRGAPQNSQMSNGTRGILPPEASMLTALALLTACEREPVLTPSSSR